MRVWDDIKKVFRESPEHWARVVLDREVKAHLDGLDRSSLRALEISGIYWANAGWRSHRTASYPEYDWCTGPLDDTFDIVIAEHVLEHVARPAAALRNTHAMLAPGGLLVVTTPFLIRIHEAPIDCTRWTPFGLEQLLNECGFPIVETGSWGNRRCVKANLGRWARYKPWRHTLHNDPACPVVVWAFARRDDPQAV
jgi:SAM-dependent methyltransferase